MSSAVQPPYDADRQAAPEYSLLGDNIQASIQRVIRWAKQLVGVRDVQVLLEGRSPQPVDWDESAGFVHEEPLVAPSGQTVGTLRLSDPRPRPQGLEDPAPAVTRDLAFALINALELNRGRERLENMLLDSRNVVAKLEASERTYRFLFERNPMPMWVFDHETLRFLAVNDAAVEMYGYSVEEFLSMSIADIRPPEEVPRLLEQVRSGRGRHTWVPGWTHIRKDGSRITVDVYSHEFEFEGRPSRLVLINDVTEKQRLEEQLRQAQRMEAVGRLAGGIAHDFNNLLTVINGYAAIMLKRLRPEDPLRRELEPVAQAGERAAGLTRQLLAFSRGQVMQPRVVDLNEILRTLEPMLARLMREDIDLKVMPASTLWKVKIDPTQIEQVILNLAINSSDAMPQGGELTIETANVTLDEAYARDHIDVKPGPHVLLAVSDTGIGMDSVTQARIFEPFFTTKGRGTGLGLSTAYGIVKQSGGNIWVYSEPYRGTIFKVYLPAAIDSAGPERVPVPTPAGGEHVGGSVLIVEDDAQVRQFAGAVLRSLGYTVEMCEDGEVALERIAAGFLPALVITDVVMPRMGGRELADRLAKLHPEIRVLFVSGYTENAIVHHGALDPGVNFLSKPFTPESLATSVRETLRPPDRIRRILVVDDEREVRLYFCNLLKEAGYEVLGASDGSEAVAAMRQSAADLILLDLVMPEQEGLETIQLMRAEFPAAKIVAISGKFEGKFLSVARHLGAHVALAKPVDGEKLLATIRELLA
ncbi:MAG: response regulator [Bryobacteraceae bacterium]|nr:response regulator [Bryobacteraceae bacterium]